MGRAARGSGIAAFSSIFTNPHRVEGGKRRRASTVVSAIFALPHSTVATWAPKMRQQKRKKTSFSPKSALNHSLRSVFLLKSTFWHRLVFFDFHGPPFYGGLLTMIFYFFVFRRVSASLLILAFAEMAQRGPAERPMSQDAPKRPQDALKRSSRCPTAPPKLPRRLPRASQGRPKSAPRGRKRNQEDPRDPPDDRKKTPGCSKSTPKTPQAAPKTPQDAPKRSARHFKPHFLRHNVARNQTEAISDSNLHSKKDKKSKLDGEPKSTKRVLGEGDGISNGDERGSIYIYIYIYIYTSVAPAAIQLRVKWG